MGSVTAGEWVSELCHTTSFLVKNQYKVCKFLPQAWAMSETFELMFDKHNLKYARNFKPRESDIFIVTAPKCGTTWLQQIVHQLRTGGDMSFEEISQVVPWLETTYGMGIDPDADQHAQPRVYKTHMPYEWCPKGAAKYIYVSREPKDALLSMYNMCNGWIVDWKDSNFFAELVMRTFWSDIYRQKQQSCPIWHHMISWLPHIQDPNVLWLSYEDMQKNLPFCVELIANFLDIGRDNKELQKLVVERSTFQFMKAQGSKFKYLKVSNAKLKREKRLFQRKVGKKRQELRKRAAQGGPLVNNGEVGRYKKQLNEHVIAVMDERWRRVIQKETGIESYEKLRQYTNKMQGIDFQKMLESKLEKEASGQDDQNLNPPCHEGTNSEKSEKIQAGNKNSNPTSPKKGIDDGHSKANYGGKTTNNDSKYGSKSELNHDSTSASASEEQLGQGEDELEGENESQQEKKQQKEDREGMYNSKQVNEHQQETKVQKGEREGVTGNGLHSLKQEQSGQGRQEVSEQSRQQSISQSEMQAIQTIKGGMYGDPQK